MLTIVDLDTRESWTFTRTNFGYAQAAAKRDAITQQGHRVGGDLGDLRIAGY
jgi:hypothetical protein